MTKRRETSTVEYGADESGGAVNLEELKRLVATADTYCMQAGLKASEYEVYVIQKSGNISDIASWSPRDFNRGGVAFIIR